MNFPPFGGPFSAAIPNIHQFATTSASNLSIPMSNDTSNGRYNTGLNHHLSNVSHFNQQQMPKLRSDGTIDSNDISNGLNGKYNLNTNPINNEYIANIPTYAPLNVSAAAAAAAAVSHQVSNIDDRTNRMSSSSLSSTYQTTQNINGPLQTSQMPEITQDLCNALLNQQTDAKKMLQNINSGWQSLTPSSTVADYLSHLPASTLPLSLHHFLKYSAENIKKENTEQLHQNTSSGLNFNSLGSSLLSTANILNQALPSTQGNQINIPIAPNQLQQQQQQQQQHNQQQQQQQQQQPHGQNQTSNANPINTTSSSPPTMTNNNNNNDITNNTTNQSKNSSATMTTTTTIPAKPKKKKKKKPAKEKKPRPKPGEIRLTTALDGSTLYCCPECQMCYPERDLLEQHLVGHNLERRFICDICNAALKRKDHLTRHKQSHNPERPFVCTVCMKAFKRKEQLSLHFVIHSGEKRHLCNECGKGFYRKDHLRKHTRSHISRRLKAELNQDTPSPNLLAAQQLQQQMQQQNDIIDQKRS